jgi:hypothetical protein
VEAASFFPFVPIRLRRIRQVSPRSPQRPHAGRCKDTFLHRCPNTRVLKPCAHQSKATDAAHASPLASSPRPRLRRPRRSSLRKPRPLSHKAGTPLGPIKGPPPPATDHTRTAQPLPPHSPKIACASPPRARAHPPHASQFRLRKAHAPTLTPPPLQQVSNPVNGAVCASPTSLSRCDNITSCSGGRSRMAALVKSKTTPLSLFVGAGHWLSGTMSWQLFQRDDVATVERSLGAVDLFGGHVVFANFIDAANLTVVSANVLLRDFSKSILRTRLKRYQTFAVGGGQNRRHRRKPVRARGVFGRFGRRPRRRPAQRGDSGAARRGGELHPRAVKRWRGL